MDVATIYALATPAPTRARPGALATIRVSGPRATDVFLFLTEERAFLRGHSARDPSLPEPRRLAVRTLRHPLTNIEIDRALVVWFDPPRSATGEAVVELHLHGGRAVTAAALDAIAALGFCRLAAPGEFTRRAFEHGKLDLTEAEGVADLVAAETEAQRRQALAQADGGLHRLYEGWRTVAVRLLAHLEAAIDFPDEDLPDGLADTVRTGMAAWRAELVRHLADRRGERLREGIAIAILGPPNAGKSSLLNLLARRDAAIVSEIAGTTRDAIEVHLDLGGWPVTLVDTAGLRASDDAIEREGVRRALARAAAADLRLAVVAADDPRGWAQALRALVAETPGWDGARDLALVNKVDLLPDRGALIAAQERLSLSTLTEAGLPELLVALEARLAALMEAGADSPAPALTRARHRAAVQGCVAALDRALVASEVALAAEDLRLAVRELGALTGLVRVDDLLDAIFRDFCIGK